MAPSPTGITRESHSHLIREMSQSLRESRSSQLPLPSSPAHGSRNDTNTLPSADLDLGTGSSFNPEQDEVLESTRNRFDDTTQPIPNIRASAARYRYWQPPQSAQRVDTSMVEHEFQDFSDDASGDVSKSVEIGRGQNRSNRNTPSKLLGEMSPNAFSIGNDSLYNISEARNRPRVTPRKNDGVDRGNLRRDAQLRRASSLPQRELENISARLGRNSEGASAGKSASDDRRRGTLAQMHARLTSEEDTSFIDERPPTATFTVKNTRFGNPRSRQTSGVFNDMTAQTPQKSIYATPRTAPGTVTQQSFMLPDLPNLTELVSGTYKDGTPVFSRSAKARSRFSSAPRFRNLNDTTKHVPIESVPIPSDEKALFTSLQLLKDKLAQMEQEKAEADKKIEEYETEVADLRAELNAREEMRRSDSALGSTDGEGNKKENWRVEKTRLESQVESLRNRLDRAERKNSVSEIATKRITEERDNAVTQLGVAFFNSEELKGERDALQAENDTLRGEIDALRAENEELHLRLAQYEEQTHRLQKNSDRKDSAIRKENETLYAELKKVEAVRVEHAKLRGENETLKAQVEQIRAQREEENRRRNRKETELRSKIDRRDETIQQLQDMTQEEVNGTLRNENEELRVQLAQLEAEREDDEREWARRETRLRRKVEKSQETAREAHDITKEILNVRHASSQRRVPRADQNDTQAGPFDNRERRPSGNRRDKSTQARTSDRVDEVRQASRKISAPRSKSRARPASARGEYRSVSAPQPYVQHAADTDSETESTTDLDAFSQSRNVGPSMHGAVPGLSSGKQEHTGDTTELSFMGRDEIARLRKALEEERAAARKQSRAPSQTRYDDTVRSQILPRKSSMKDLTSASRPMDLTETNTGRIVSANPSAPASPTKQDTQQSIFSQSSRRRRSAPVEMTSAFILPDITMNTRVPPPKPHNDADCSVCRKTSCSGEHTTPINIPNPVPVSDRMPDDIDATLRPAQPAPLALATVIKELQDELTHLNLQKAAYDTLLRSHDPSLSKRKRKAVEAKIADLLTAIGTKSDQIYALYDVVEGQKVAGQLSGNDQKADGEEMDEKEIEETLMSVGIDPEEMRQKTKEKAKGKRVVIEERERIEGGRDGESDDGLPWEGISDTESLPDLNASAGWKRKAVY